MIAAAAHIFRLFRAARTFARYDVVPVEHLAELPGPARLGHRLLKIELPWGEKTSTDSKSGGERLTEALTELGPSYIKLGQFLATRPDIIGAGLSQAMSSLQDRLPPFSKNEALQEIRRGLGQDADDLFAEIGPPVAAASIAQVHRATTREEDGAGEDVAVKVLRPGIEKRFARDLDSYFFAARLMERLHRPSRRLRPVDAVATLAHSVHLEMDLRMEAAAISEMAENTAADPGFRVPKVDWARTAQRVLTLEWIDGVPLNDIEGLAEAGHDLEQLGATVIQSFLRHAMRDGFFHADMHQGNLFVDADGTLVAVDFGIMGRLSPKDRRFLAEILYGFINRDYTRVAQVHFDAGYVPRSHSVNTFAQALRAIGEPLMDKEAEEISMARLLGQLFHVTEQFDMQTQPQLLLLQKTMVVVEGVARSLNPRLNMWTTSEPVVEEWMQAKLGPEGRIQEAAEGAAVLGRFVGGLPELLARAERTAHMIEEMADGGGLKLDRETSEAIAKAQSNQSSAGRWALWVAAGALVVIALTQVF